MSGLKVEFLGLEQLYENVSHYPERAVQACVVAAQMTQAIIVNDARADHPYKDKTGNLTNSIQPGAVVVSDYGVSAYVEARMGYATFVEFGTSRAKPYPFLVPAMLRQAEKFKQRIAKQLKSIRFDSSKL